MNLYDILEIGHNATQDEIRKAYCRLAKKYHPDKCTDQDPKELFQEIRTAYEILSDVDKRKEYDMMSMEQKMEVYDLIKQYFMDIKPQHSHIYDSIISILYPNEESAFKSDVNSFNIKNIFARITNKIINNSLKIAEITGTEHNLHLTFKEKYNETFKYVQIGDNQYMVPTYETNFTIDDIQRGCVKINITCDEHETYKIINNHDLMCIKNVSLSQYIYGGVIKLHDINGSVTIFSFSTCLEKKPIFIVKQKGLPKSYSKERGDLYIYLNIEGINSIIEDDICEHYKKTVEETLKLIFPAID